MCFFVGESKCIFGKDVSATWNFFFCGGDKYIREAKGVGIFCAYIAVVVCDGMA